jgi:hypothetical protein
MIQRCGVSAPAGTAVLLAAVWLLQSCGGGGGGGGDGGGSNDVGRVTFSTKNVQAAGTPGDVAPVSLITLAISGNAPPTVYYSVDYSQEGLDIVLFEQTGPAGGELSFRFHNPGSLPNGTYQDTLEIRICADYTCQTDLRGSPATINTTYVVSGEGSTSATISPQVISISADQRDNSIIRRPVTVTLNEMPAAGIYFDVSHTSNAVNSIGWSVERVVTDLSVGFQSATHLAVGTHTDTIEIRACYDQNCVRQVAGSPFEVSTTVEITLGVEPGLPSLEVVSRSPLSHNFVDVEFSRSLNSIVMVGTEPANAIYVYDLTTGVERSQALSRAPTAVAVSPDGQTAAVGHDSLLSVFDVTQVGTVGAPAPTLLNVSTLVNDLVVHDNGNVHAAPLMEYGDNIHSVELATNTEQVTLAYVEMLALRPSGDQLYGTDEGPYDEIKKFDLSSGLPSFLYFWPHGAPALGACENFWFDETGSQIYTACGDVYSSDADPDLDLQHLGTLVLTEPVDYDDNHIASLSQSAADNEIAIVEWPVVDCKFVTLSPCYTRVAYYDATTLARKALYGIGPVTIAGTTYAQRGHYVFHDAQSNRRLMISELEEAPSDDERYWISVIE